MFVLLCSFTKKKTGSIFPAFCHTTFLHPYILSGVFDFSQGHVTKNQPMAVFSWAKVYEYNNLYYPNEYILQN